MISEDKNTDAKCKAKGLISKLESAKHMFNMFLMRDLAHILEMNSKNLQKNDLTAEEAMDCITKIEIRLAEMRSNVQEFEKLIKKVEDLELQIDANPANRPRKAPKRIEDFIAHDVAPSGHDSNDLKTELKRVYIGAIDSIVSSMKERFDQNDIKTAKDINRMLISCANNEVDVTTEYVIKHLSVAAKFLQVDLLIEELKDLHVHINLYNMELKLESMPIIKKVTAISTIQDVLNAKVVSKASLPETHKLLVLMSTYAMSSATAERTFSVMRRVKTWLRSRMGPVVLTNCMFAEFIRKEFTI